MKYLVETDRCRDFSVSSELEWILPNGIGGYAMGTVSGANTRRYHAHLVAATDAPAVRMVLLAGIEAYVNSAGNSYGISTNQYSGAVHPMGYQKLSKFSVGQVAEWIFDLDGHPFAKRIFMHQGENACTIEYANLGSEPVQLSLRPLVCHKHYHDNFRVADFYPEFLVFPEDKTILSHQGIMLCIEHPGAERTPTTGWYYRFEYTRELERGLEPLDDLYCPCELRYILPGGESIFLVAADHEGAVAQEIPVDTGDKHDIEESLSQAAAQFFVKTPTRTSIIAGYPWFTDWGRDTMISLPGVCLERGLFAEAKAILRSYAGQMRYGLIPNRFVDVGEMPEYNTVDATLWFANAIYLTLKKEWDAAFAAEAFKWLSEVYTWHMKGTQFGIKVDAEDGLLTQGIDGVQLTWMDAKVKDWVVTPRHGKPVEINGLWINTLRILEWLAKELNQPADVFGQKAEQAESSFRAKFWHERTGHYLDTIEPDDASLRPNQVIAMSLPFSPATGEQAIMALDRVTKELLTPFGLRTLGTQEAGYVGRYQGDMPQRDAAYHQGTVWPWLLGPYCSALVRLKGDNAGALSILSGAAEWLQACGLGGIAEVYDGDAPQRPSGCPWQAWSVAEVLRAYREAKQA